MESIQACYERGLIDNPKATGLIRVKWTIDRKGKVQNAVLNESSVGHEEVEQCLVSLVEGLTFPAPANPTVLRYPFVFKAVE